MKNDFIKKNFLHTSLFCSSIWQVKVNEKKSLSAEVERES